jgi:hypothetical protein
VKPWLIGNSDPNGGGKFVDPATGLVETPATLILGKQFWLSSDCKKNPPNTCSGLIVNPPSNGNVSPGGPAFDYFVPAQVTTNAGDICPSSTAAPCGAGNDPADKAAIECCNITPYTCGGNSINANFTPLLDPAYPGDATSDLAQGTECFIHASAEQSGQGQDTLDWNTFPNGPPVIVAGGGPQAGKNVSTSSSIVTIPILDTTNALPLTPPNAVTVIGFLQAFVNSVDDLGAANHHGDVNITVLNVIGCSQTPVGQNPVIGGNGASPIPVRLITPP